MAFIGLDCAVQQGTNSFTAFDRISGGEIGYDQSIEHLTGAGGQDSVVYQMIEPKGNVETWLQSTSLLGKVTRSAVNALPTLIPQIDGGVLGAEMVKHTDCYINGCELSCDIGGAVKANFDWVALGITTSAITQAAATPAKNLIITWHDANVLLNGGTFACQTWNSKVANGLKLHTSQDAKSVGAERLPENVTPGNFAVSLTAEFKAPPTMDFLVDIPATVTFAFRGVNSAGGTFAHTVGQLHPITKPTKIAAGEDDVTWSVELECDHNNLTTWTFTLA